MNPEKRASQIEAAALQAAQKALRRHPGQPVTRDELLHLRVQVAPLWLRLSAALLGLGLLAGGVWLIASSTVAGGVVVALIGLGLLFAGVLGWRKTVESRVDLLGEALGNLLIEAVLNSLDGL